jgi:hypothetical protein
MRNFGIGLVIILATLGGAALVHAANGEAVKVQLADGGTWRGSTGERVRVVYLDRSMRRTAEGTLARFSDGWLELTGDDGKRLPPIYNADVQSIERLEEAGQAPSPAGETDPVSDGEPTDAEEGAAEGSSTDAPSPSENEDGEGDESIRPTFILPLTGMVGLEFRAEEIEAITAEADELGPGQTIVLEINSGGGYVAEWEMIRDSIYEAQKRHRVVAWVLDGTSAACSTSVACDVIVMKSSGHMGSVTTLMGAPSAPMEYQVREAERGMANVLRKAGRSPKLAVPFKTGDHPWKSLLSYTKDSETGDVTWFQSLEGDVIMNRPGQVLGFDARQAVDCGLAIGIADTKEELGQLLDQGGWREIGSGEEIHEKWNDTVKRCQKSIKFSLKEFGELGDDEEGLRKKIKIVEKWLRWYRDAANVPTSMYHGGQFFGRKQLEQMLMIMKEQLRELRED